MLKLVGAPSGTEFRKLTGTLPGPPAAVEFTEFRGVPRTKFTCGCATPALPRWQSRWNNLNGMVAQLKAAGTNIISANGQIVDFGGGTFNIFVEDPNGMNIEVFERTRAASRQGTGQVGCFRAKPARSPRARSFAAHGLRAATFPSVAVR